MYCQKSFDASNKNLNKTNSGSSLAVRLKMKQIKNEFKRNRLSVSANNCAADEGSIVAKRANVPLARHV